MRGSSSNISARTLWQHIQLRRKNISFHGAVLAFFIVSAITTFIMGIQGLTKIGFSDDEEEGSGSRMSFNIFTYTLPFVAFIYDHSSKRILNLTEKTAYILIKLMIIIYYLGAYVLALQ